MLTTTGPTTICVVSSSFYIHNLTVVQQYVPVLQQCPGPFSVNASCSIVLVSC